ncbi:MAG: TetR/AcrR family transcriptional regulator [Janthinobacterium lividum]
MSKSADNPVVARAIRPTSAPRGGATQARLREFGAWIAEGKLPEVIPTHQERSLRTALAMLEAGHELLVDRALDDLSVEAVCQHAGTTVGAFYGRFENKHAFFVTLQRMQIIRSQIKLSAYVEREPAGDASDASDGGFSALCRELVVLTVGNFTENVGVMRASLQHAREGMWAPYIDSGIRYRAALIVKLSPFLSHIAPKRRKLRILFAYQAVAGVLVHALLNNPGPLGIGDEAMISELARLMEAYLLAP